MSLLKDGHFQFIGKENMVEYGNGNPNILVTYRHQIFKILFWTTKNVLDGAI